MGVDGSADAQVALEWAGAEADLRKVPLTIITVVPPIVIFGPARAPVVRPAGDETLKAAAMAMSAAAEEATVGREASFLVRAAAGAPAEILLNASADADMLVVGSRGYGGFGRLLLGSVSSLVVHHADCPVVVIPPRSRS